MGKKDELHKTVCGRGGAGGVSSSSRHRGAAGEDVRGGEAGLH